MRLATGATHARDTREKAPVFIRAVLRKKPLRRRFLSARPISATSFIRNPRSIKDSYKRDAEKNSASTTVTPISVARVTIVAFGMHTLRFLS